VTSADKDLPFKKVKKQKKAHEVPVGKPKFSHPGKKLAEKKPTTTNSRPTATSPRKSGEGNVRGKELESVVSGLSSAKVISIASSQMKDTHNISLKSVKKNVPKGSMNEIRVSTTNRKHLKFLNKKRLDSVDRVDLLVEDPTHNVPVDKIKKGGEVKKDMSKIKIKNNNNIIALSKLNSTNNSKPTKTNLTDKVSKERSNIAFHNKVKISTQGKQKNLIKNSYNSNKEKHGESVDIKRCEYNGSGDSDVEGSSQSRVSEERKIKLPIGIKDSKMFSPENYQSVSEDVTPKDSLVRNNDIPLKSDIKIKPINIQDDENVKEDNKMLKKTDRIINEPFITKGEFTFTDNDEYLNRRRASDTIKNLKREDKVHNDKTISKNTGMGLNKSPENTSKGIKSNIDAIKNLINTMKKDINAIGITEEKKENISSELLLPVITKDKEQEVQAISTNKGEVDLKDKEIIDVLPKADEENLSSEIDFTPHNEERIPWQIQEDDIPLSTDAIPLGYKNIIATKEPTTEECNILDEESTFNKVQEEPENKKIDSPIKNPSFDEEPIPEEARFGIEYFFGESSVPTEIVDLVDCLNGYTDELVEKKKLVDVKKKSVSKLAKIEEELSDQDTPLPRNESETVVKKVKEPVTTARLSLNPLLQNPNISLELRATLGSKTCSPDIEALCRGLAYAIRQHILFAHGKQTFQELKTAENTRFSYRLGKFLKIDLDEAKQALNVDKSKDILSDSLASLTGTRINRDLLSSYLTAEEDEDELEYTKSQISDIFGDGKEDFMRSYRNSLASIRSSKIERLSLHKVGAESRFSIRGYSDVSKFLETQTKSRSVLPSRKSATLKEHKSRLEENKDRSIKRDVSSPSEAVPDNIFEISKEQEEKPDEVSAEYVKAFSVFQLNYDFDANQFYDISLVPEDYLTTPSEKDIYKFCKKVVIYSKMEKEILIIALIYVEKLIMKTGLLMNELNWRRFIFTALVIASKVWDDESFQNSDFIKVFTDVSLQEINELEMTYLELLDYRLNIKGSEYAKYYFILRTVAERTDEKFPLKPMTVNKMIQLQSNAERVQQNIKETYEIIRKTQ